MIKSLTIIIPIYNEENNINKYLKYYFNKLSSSKIDFEIVVVESNSTDFSRKKLELFRNHKKIKICYENKKKGYGSAIKLGLINSSKKFVTTFPIDNQYSITDLIKICLISNNNVITFRKSNLTSPFKRFRSNIFRNMCNFIFNLNYNDINSLKIISREFLLKKNVFNKLSNSWIIDLEILILLSKYKRKNNQIGINLRDRQHDVSKVRIYDNLLMFLKLIKSKLKFFF